MYYFVPSYYQKTGKWRGNSWVWYANRSMREFDDIVSQIKMFRAAEKEVTLVVPCYIPDLRYYMHRQGLSGIRIYSLFDQIQGVFSYAPGLLMWEDLDWPEDMEWVYTQFLIMGYQDGVHVVNIEFGPESYLLWIDRFEQKKKVCRQIYDDRGFLSSEIIYRDGREVEQIFYNTYGRKTCTYDLVQGTVLVKGRDGLKKYEKMEDLVRECIERYFLEQKKKCGSSGVLVLSASTFHNRLFLEGSGDIVTILSCYSERNTEQTDIYQIKMAIQGEYKKTPALVLVDTKELKEKIAENERFMKIEEISPFDTRLKLGSSQRIRAKKIFLPIQGLNNQREIIKIIAQYMEKNLDAELVIAFSEPGWGRQEKIEEEIKKLLEELDITSFSLETKNPPIVENAQQDEEKVVPARVKVVRYLTEQDVIQHLEDIRLLVDLRDSPELYLQIAAISSGIPQVNLTQTRYVRHLKNGFLLDSIDELFDSLCYYLDGLSNWNQALVHAVEDIRLYTGGSLVKKIEMLLRK